MAYLPPSGGRMNVTIGGNTAGVGAAISTGTMALAGGNNITLSQNGANGLTINGGGGGLALANSQTTYTSGTAQLLAGGGAITIASTTGQKYNFSVPATSSISGSGIVSIAANGNTLSIGAPAYSAGMSNLGNTGGNSGMASNQLVLQGGNNLTLSQTTGAGGNTLAFHAPSPGAGAAISAAGASASNGTVIFSNSNGLAFGMNGSTVTGSYTVPTVTNSSFTVQAGASTLSSVSRMAFGDGNGISFGASTSNNGSITITGSVATTYAASNHSHGNPTLSLSNLSGATASASNGLTLSLSAAAQSNQIITAYAGSNTFSSSSGTVNASSMRFVGSGNVSVGVVNGSVMVSGAGGAGGGVAFANSETTYTSGTVNLSGDGQVNIYSSVIGASQYLRVSIPGTSSLSASGAFSIASNGATISMGVPAFSAGMSSSTYGGSTGGTSGTASNQVIFAAGSNITLSQSTGAGGNTVAIYGPNALTSQSNQAVSGANGSFTFQTLSLSNANGISFGTSAGSAVTASHNGITSQTNQNLALSAVGNTTQTSTGTMNATNMYLSGAGNVSIGYSNGSAIISGGGGGGGVALSAPNSSYSSGTLNFTGGGALTVTANANTLSFNAPSVSSLSATGALSLSTNGNTISIGAPVVSNLSATGIVSLSTNGNVISIGAPAFSAGMSSSTYGGVTSGTSGMASNQLVIAAGSNITLSQSTGTDGNTLAIHGESGGGGGATYSYYNPQDAYLQVTGQQGQGTLHIQPTPAPNVTFDRFVFPINFSGATASTASITMSMWAGIYTRNASTLSLSTSFSSSQGITHSGTANSTVNVGQKLFTMGASGSLSEGQYYVGILSRTTSGGANASLSQMLASQLNSNFAGIWGVSSAASNQFTRGLGVYSASTSALPASIAFSQLNGTASLVLRQPLFYVINGTV